MVVNTNLGKIECAKAIKGADYIECLDENDHILVRFGGITDFGGYSVEDGEFTDAPLGELTEIKLAIAETLSSESWGYMAKLYVFLIKKNLKTLNDVPQRWRAEVEELLDET